VNSLIDLIQSPAITAAIVAAAVALIVTWRQHRREARSARQDVFSAGYAAYAAYREMPYVVRRRGASDPESERRRCSELMREVQERISYHLAWTTLYSRDVGDAYGQLVADLRRVAGRAVSTEWTRSAIANDAQMNAPDIDLSALDSPAEQYLLAVDRHLHPIASRLRRLAGRP